MTLRTSLRSTVYLCFALGIACGDDDGSGTPTGDRDSAVNRDGQTHGDGSNTTCTITPSGTDREVGSMCGDGIDNDCDGFTDCADLTACEGAVGFCPGRNNTDCSDVPTGADENTAAMCSDGCDNDRDGYVDCEDSDCYEEGAGCVRENTAETCSDGEDNDRDGFPDCRDQGCQDTGVCDDAGTTPDGSVPDGSVPDADTPDANSADASAADAG